MNTPEPQPQENPPPVTEQGPSPSEPNLSEEELAQLQDAELQAQYRQEYLLQLACRRCEGCGE